MNRRTALKMILGTGLCSLALPRWLEAAAPKPTNPDNVGAEHGMIGDAETGSADHNQHPGAQWYPHAGFGLFLHWGLASVRAMNISWPMIPGRALAKQKLSDDELARVIREQDWNLTGKPNEITPNQYWEQVKGFNPQQYDPEKWCQAARDAGFIYVVLTTKHHEGFALWPSAFGNFNTTLYAGGKDLVKDYVAACRKFGLKVGLYFSGPDWHFDRDYMNFLYGGATRTNPGLPSIDGDLKPRTTKPTNVAQHQADFAKLFRGQIEELLTGYGEINVLWFDGKPNFPNPAQTMPLSRIRELQPQIVVDGRLHGKGDFYTYERALPTHKTVPGWAELCQPWTTFWPYVANAQYRADAWVLGQLARCRAMGVNLLLDLGPKSSGELPQESYDHLAVVAKWMQSHSDAAHDVDPLPAAHASVPASSKGTTRYLYLIPQFNREGNMAADQQPPKDQTVTLKEPTQPTSVRLLADGKPLDWKSADNAIQIAVPASRRTTLVDVIAVELA